MRAPSPIVPASPVTATATTTPIDHVTTTAAPTPTRDRIRGADDVSVAVAFAHPAAAKKTGIGASAATTDQPGCRARRLAPRTSPSGLSITARARCPRTTMSRARTRATSTASRRVAPVGASAAVSPLPSRTRAVWPRTEPARSTLVEGGGGPYDPGTPRPSPPVLLVAPRGGF